MNIKLLRAAKRKILAEPRQFQMQLLFDNRLPRIPNCGTAACIAGWALCLNKAIKPSDAKRGDGLFNIARAVQALGLDHCQKDKLFFEACWPEQFQGGKPQSKRAARLAAERIEHFIKTKGAE